MRAFAALAVFLFHFGQDWHWRPANWVAGQGRVGVTFFFILSGFVLTWGAKPTLGVLQFWRRRVARIYPSHVVMAVVALMLPVIAKPRAFASTAANLVLLQSWSPNSDYVESLNPVSWSLSCEAFFYFSLPFLLLLLRRMALSRQLATLGVIVAGATLFRVAAAIHGGTAIFIAFTNPLARSGDFCLGVGAALLMQTGRRTNVQIRWAVLLLIGVGVSSRTANLSVPLADLVFDLPLLLLIMCAAARDIDRAPGWLQGRTLVYLGGVSFAFYLVHELILINLFDAFDVGRVSGLGGAGELVGLLAVCLAAAIVLHHVIEKPAQGVIAGRSSERHVRRRVAAEQMQPAGGDVRPAPGRSHTGDGG